MEKELKLMKIKESLDNFKYFLEEYKYNNIDFISVNKVYEKFKDLFGDLENEI